MGWRRQPCYYIFVNKREAMSKSIERQQRIAGLLIEGEHLGREFPMPSHWYSRKPELSSDSQVLLFGPFFTDGPDLERLRTVRQLLDEFIELADAPAARIFGFAKRWGSLHLCAHGLPPAHAEASPAERQHLALARRKAIGEEMREAWPDRERVERLQEEFDRLTREEVAQWLSPLSPCPLPTVENARNVQGQRLPPSDAERVDSWRSIAKEFRAILESAAALNSNDIPRKEIWPRHNLAGRGPWLSYPDGFGNDHHAEIIRALRFRIGHLVDQWLTWCPLHLRCSWSDDAPGIYLAPRRDSRTSLDFAYAGAFHHPLLLPVLVLQVSAAVFDVRPVRRFCAICGSPLAARRVLPGRPRKICDRVGCKLEAVRRRKRKSISKVRQTKTKSANAAEKASSRQSRLAKTRKA